MRKRIYVFFNFFAFNLLFFALYLNFIHKDAVAAMPRMRMSETEHLSSAAASSHIKPVTKGYLDTQKTSKKLSPAKDGDALNYR